MVALGKSLETRLLDDPELYGKPCGARLALVCPHPDTPDPLARGVREATVDHPIFGLDGGEGSSPAMDVGAEVWWVVEPLPSGLPLSMLCSDNGQVELLRVNVKFAGLPSEAVDYLVRTSMHPSAAVFGATIYATTKNALAAVGDLGVAISLAGPSHAGHGGVAISSINDMMASAGRGGIAIGSTYQGIARSGNEGQSYTGRLGVSSSGHNGVAIAGERGRATATHVVVGECGVAEVLRGSMPMFAAGIGSRVYVDGVALHAGVDYEPGVAYRVHFAANERPTLERQPELDAFAERAALDAGCSITTDLLVHYFLAERPLCSAAAREHSLYWTSTLRSEHGPLELPKDAREYLDEARRQVLAALDK